MGDVIGKEEIDCEKEYCEDIAQNNPAVEIIQFRNKDIHKEGDGQEDTADAATDSIDQSQNALILAKTT